MQMEGSSGQVANQREPQSNPGLDFVSEARPKTLPDNNLSHEPKVSPSENVPKSALDGVKTLQSVKSFQKSPSLKDRLQLAVAKKTGHVLPILEGQAETPPPNLSQRLQAIVGKRQGEKSGLNGVGRGSFGSKDHVSMNGDGKSENLSKRKDNLEGQESSHAGNEVAEKPKSPEEGRLPQVSSPVNLNPDRNPIPDPVNLNPNRNPNLADEGRGSSPVPSGPQNGHIGTKFEALARRIIDAMEKEQRRSMGRVGPFAEVGPSKERAVSFPPSQMGLDRQNPTAQTGLAVGPDLNLPAEPSEGAAREQVRDLFAQPANLDDSSFSGGSGATQEDVAMPDPPAASRKRASLELLEAGTLKPLRGGGANRAHIVDLSSDSSGEDEPIVGPGGLHLGERHPSGGSKRQLPEWAKPGRPSKRRAFGSQSAPGGLELSLGGPFANVRASSPEIGGHSSELSQATEGRVLPEWSAQRGKAEAASKQAAPPVWPVAKPGSLEALRGAAAGGSGGAFGRSQSMLDREAAKALAGPLREAALAHSGQPASLHAHYQQQALDHQRQQQAHFQRRLLPPTMHTHTLAAGPSAPRDNDVALRGVLEGMATSGPLEEADPPEGSMTVPLLKHQRLALCWMRKRESGTMSDQPVGGILADDQGLGKTISTIALIMSNKAPPRPSHEAVRPTERASPANSETVDLDDYKEVFVTSADDADDELMEIPPENVQLRLEYRPGVSQSRFWRDEGEPEGATSGGERKDSDSEAVGKGKEVIESKPPAPSGGFLQEAGWGLGNAADSLEDSAPANNDWGGLRMQNGVLLAEGGGAGLDEPTKAPVVKTRKRGRAAKKEEGATEKPESSSGGMPRDPLSRRGRPPAGTLIVCPTSVLRQWANEVRDKVAPGERLRLLIYHGVGRTKDPYELAQYDIVLTTYAIVSMEVPKQPLPESEGGASNGLDKAKDKPPKSKSKKAKPLGEDEGLLPPGSGPLARVAWFRVVLDEAQSIKNARTQAARAAWSLRAKRRWCLSGTPIQNSIDDLYSYFRFLRFAPYDVFKSFRSLVREPIARNPTVGYRRLQVILSMIMLRRTKQTVIEGRPIIDLPPRIVRLSQADFTAEERGFYDTLEKESRQKFNAFRSAGTLNKNYVNILWMLLRLRQACNHWSLVKGLEGGDHHDSKEAELVARKLRPELRTALLEAAEGLQSACSLCHDAPEEAVISKCGHVFCRQCIAEQVNNTDNLEPYACQVCKSPITPKDVFSPATLRKVERGQVDGPDLATSSAEGSGPSPAVRSSSKINNMIRILSELPKRVVTVSRETGETVGDHKGEAAGERSPDEEGSGMYVRETTEKAIIFSQWTSMLDLLEGPLQHAGFQYRRLDGTMTVQSRDRAISDFTKRPEVTVIIMSLKAASLGLNLVAASHVLLLDVWWNPTTEDQAIDRAHRIGQTRTVNVSRLAVRATVEDRILALQEKKRQIVASAFGEQEGGGTARLSAEDLAFLFRSQ